MSIADVIKIRQDRDGMLLRSLQRIIQLYTDKSHFIYELLQNAEDAGAAEIYFLQTDVGLEVFHDGRPFTLQNLSALCDIGNSDKTRDYNLIGEFGVGFKSVFSICERVQVFSQPIEDNLDTPAFAIEIDDFTTPRDIPQVWIPKQYTTRFVFPYCAGKDFSGYVDVNELKRVLSKRLNSLGCETLLFMRNLQSIRYEINLSDYQKKGDYRIEKQCLSSICSKIYFLIDGVSDHKKYLKYSKMLPDNPLKSVDIAYQFQMDKEGKEHFVAAKNPYISVYFPTETESKLSFIVQGPYRTTPNRSSIPTDNEENRSLALLTSVLLHESVLDIKDRRLLTIEFLALLPISPSNFSDHWLLEPLYKQTVNLMQNHPIIPTVNGAYVKAGNAVIARAQELVEVFQGHCLAELINEPPDSPSENEELNSIKQHRLKQIEWLPTVLTETSQQFGNLHRYLVNQLEVKVIRQEDLSKYLGNRSEYFLHRDAEWMNKFYNYLYRLGETTGLLRNTLSPSRGSLLNVPFIKTSRDHFVPPYILKDNKWEINVFLPDLPILNDILYINEDTFQQHPTLFRSILGLTKPDAFMRFIKSIKKDMSKCDSIDKKVYFKYLKQCIQYMKNPDKASKVKETLRGYAIIRCIDGSFCCPGDNICSISRTEEGVSAADYYYGTDVMIVDDDYYTDNEVDTEMLEFLGVRAYIANNRFSSPWEYTVFSGNSQERDETGFYSKLTFENLEEVTKYIIKNPNDSNTKKKSRILMEMLFLYESHLSGNRIKGKAIAARVPSFATVIYELHFRKWLFSKDGILHSPSEISKYDLDEKIYGNVKVNSYIYDLLDFQKNEKDRFQETMTSVLQGGENLKEATLDALLQDYFEFSLDDVRMILQEGAIKSTDLNFDFPTRPIYNFNRLIRKTEENYQSSIRVKYEMKMQPDRVTYNGKYNRQYLSSMYTYPEHLNKTACQMCKLPTSFPESAQIQKDRDMLREMAYMYLSLCPNCAASFRGFRSIDGIITPFIDYIRCFDIKKAQEPIHIPIGKDEITFTATHLVEVQQGLLLQEQELGKEGTKKREDSIKDDVNKHSIHINKSIENIPHESNKDVVGTAVFSLQWGYGEVLNQKTGGRLTVRFQDNQTRELFYDHYNQQKKMWYISIPEVIDNRNGNQMTTFTKRQIKQKNTKFNSTEFGEGEATRVYLHDYDAFVDILFGCGIRKLNIGTSIRNGILAFID